MSFRKKFSLLVTAIPLYYVAAVLFGAPFLSHFEDTFIFACTLSLVSVLPIIWSCEADNESICKFVLEGRVDNPRQLIAKHISVASVLGALCGAIVIPLDWDRWWQKWPIPCLFSTFVGSFLGFLFAVVQLRLNSKIIFANKHLKIV